MVLQRPLRSLFKSTTGFLSLHSEVLRMSSSGWFELTGMPRLDEGFFELCSCPGRYDPTGGVDRAYEERQRPIKDCGGPLPVVCDTTRLQLGSTTTQAVAVPLYSTSATSTSASWCLALRHS